MLSEPIESYDVKYMGGHVEYPKPAKSTAFIYQDRIELEYPDLVIPYRVMKRIENMDEKKISAKRVVGLGLIAFPLAVVGALWKKNHIYTVIQYKDQIDEKIIILDFDDNVNYFQRWIYRRMISSRHSPTPTCAEKGFLIYENEQYGFRMKYRDTWIEDELNEKHKNYFTVVEFRKFIENKPPFVTIYVNIQDSKYSSFKDFVDDEIGNVKKDSTVNLIESSNIQIGDKEAFKLVDIDVRGSPGVREVYKRMVVWIAGNNKTYEISYSAKEEQYEQYLSAVEQMIGSFTLIEDANTEVLDQDPEELKSVEMDDPLLILKRRFAKGEITEDEYKRILELLKT